jgi:hypothetical protein
VLQTADVVNGNICHASSIRQTFAMRETAKAANRPPFELSKLSPGFPASENNKGSRLAA